MFGFPGRSLSHYCCGDNCFPTAPASFTAGQYALEDSMSCSNLRIRSALISCLFLMFAMLAICSSVFAQSDSTPKWDLFVGYQYLHPNGTVPAPFGNPAAPTPFDVPDMNYGFGSSVTYNFDPHWGFEADLGHNWGNHNYETTGSGGPRFMLRTEDANFFIHTLLSYNRLGVNGLTSSNGIGTILGGGMDLPISKKFFFRLFEADYVWARHNYADAVDPQFSDLRRPSFNG